MDRRKKLSQMPLTINTQMSAFLGVSTTNFALHINCQCVFFQNVDRDKVMKKIKLFFYVQYIDVPSGYLSCMCAL